MSFKYTTKFTHVERHQLKFETQEGYEEACDRISESGFLAFEYGGCTHIGRFVRCNDRERTIEVDAAKDFDEEKSRAPKSQKDGTE